MNEMRPQTFLVRRSGSGIYYFRRKVPPDLQGFFGKTEIQRSLRTAVLKEALPLVRELLARTEQEFAAARRGITPAPPVALREPARLPTEEEVAYIAGAMRSSALEADRDSRREGDDHPPAWDIKARRDAIGQALGSGKPWEELALPLEDWLTARGFLVPPEDSKEYRRLAYAFAEAAFEVASIAMARDAGNYVPTPPAPALPESLRRKEAPSGATLRAVMDKWAKEREPAPRTLTEAGTVIREWEVLHGAFLPAIAITKGNVVAYKDALLERKPKGRSDGRLSAATVTKRLNLIKAWLTYAEENDLVPANVARGVSAGSSKTPRERRLPFTRADYRALFSSKVFTHGHRPLGGAGEASFWIPILCAATGARLEELAQLRVEDVRESEAGIWYLDIHDRGEGQRIKNASSRREVPLHPAVLSLGFLAYRDSLPPTGDLFPLVQSAAGRASSASFSKWFGRYLRQEVNIKDSRKVLHSTRHAFKDIGRDAGVPADTLDRLTGHAPTTVGGNYGTGPSLKTLHDSVLRLPLGEILGSIPAVVYGRRKAA